jgi:SPP1 gp7 family putative phage head morphogenesis protein
MPEEISVSVAFGKTPDEAVKYFESKVPRGPGGPKGHWNWTDTMRHSHDRAFVVAKATSLDLVKSIHSALAKSLREGKSYQDFANNIIPELKQRGWWGKGATVEANGKQAEINIGHKRLENIYNTNMHTAYAAGEYAAMKEEAEDFPYWRYVALSPGPTRREEHQMLNGKIYRHDDPIWSYIYPPNGWGCQCTVDQLSEWDAKNLKGFVLSKTSESDFVKKTVEIQGKEIEMTGVKIGSKEFYAQEGWDYAPGEFSVQYHAMLCQRIEESVISDEAKRDMEKQLEASMSGGFKNFTKHVLETERKKYPEPVSVAILPERAANALKSPSVLTATPKSLLHSLDEQKSADGKAMSQKEIENLPSHLKGWIEKNGIYKDKNGGALQIYSDVFEDDGKFYRYKAVFNTKLKGIDHYSLVTITKVGSDALGIYADKL